MVTKTGERLLYEDLTYQIRGACFNIWKEFGGAFKEKVVDRALTEELKTKGLDIEDQKEIDICYKGKKIASYVPDKIVNNSVILEIKCKPFLTKEDERQFWYYLKGSQYKLGFLINFGSKKLEIRRRVYDKARQKDFRVNPRSYPREAKRSASIRGFTLIELLVVLAIIAILTAIILPNYRSGHRQFALLRSAHKLAQDIRRAQEMAMSMEECKDEHCSVRFPPGYGIVIDTNWDNKKYKIYADTAGGDEFYTASDDDVEEISLEKGVFVKEMYITPTNRVKISINFKPPDPVVKIKYDKDNMGAEALITLALESDPSKTKTVKANKAGMITVE